VDVPIFVAYLHVTSLKGLAAFSLDVLFYSEEEDSTSPRNVGDRSLYLVQTCPIDGVQ
jgi:hypothetical protein